jgi:hypothetical protein
MMAKLGMNVRADGSDDLQALHALGVRWVRMVPHNHMDVRAYVNEAHALNPPIQVLFVVDGESMTQFDAGGHEVGPFSPVGAATIYSALYDTDECRVDAWELGNEVDQDPANPLMTPETLLAFAHAFRAAMPNALFVTPGSDRATPDFLKQVDCTPFSAVAIHPYGAAPPNGSSPVDFGPITGIIEGFSECAKPKQMVGKPVGVAPRMWVTEWGINWSDFGGENESPLSDAFKYLDEMMTFLLQTDTVEVAFFFCWSVMHHPDFGIHFEPDGEVAEATANERLQRFKQAVQVPA